MESFFIRYRNPMILGGLLLLQLLGLAVQVKRPADARRPDAGSVRLIRLWMVMIITPFEKGISFVAHGSQQAFHDYVNVIGLRSENQELRAQNEQLHLEEARMAEDANQAHRLQALLNFKESFPTKTLAAQVIGSGGSEQSHVLYIDKGSRDGVQSDMAVITPQGIVGKVRDVFRYTSQVLVMDDPNSGVGAILRNARLYGVVKGSGGSLILDHIMSDESVQTGEQIVTSGGDRIFPKGLPIGTVESVSTGSDLFLKIIIHPAADLNRLEEVLVVTDMSAAHAQPDEAADSSSAADILAQRLPTLEPKPAAADAAQAAGGGAKAAQPKKAAQTASTAQQKNNATQKKLPKAKAPAPVNETPPQPTKPQSAAVTKAAPPVQNTQSAPAAPAQNSAPTTPQSSVPQ